MKDYCHYIQAEGMKVLIPGCIGTAVHHEDDDPMFWCTCLRPPKYQQGKKAKLERLRYRVDLLNRKIQEIERETEANP